MLIFTSSTNSESFIRFEESRCKVCAASASSHHNTKKFLPMSIESDTDPENSGVHISASLRDVLFDPVFACAAAAAGSPTGVTLFRTLSGRVQHLMN
ncbi:unnamed protein product [Rotaria sordida]|uniref:Uncharacterized protein n=1 Tax=Rotaria sordida TaxID=392033 RepID=A0A818K476_9BILA|nr:unnamed protein product [Rotaria sordida]CAF3551242.1 unnamed protein product [Rotaria sordida]